MSATLEGGRETIGDQLIYDALADPRDDRQADVLQERQNDSRKRACSLEKSTDLHYDGKNQTITEPASATRALRTSEAIACETPLKALMK